MQLAGDNPEPRPVPTMEPVATQHIQVTPDNVVELAKLFSDCAARLYGEAKHIRQDLKLKEPWLGDPASEWAWDRFNEYFVDGEHSFATVLEHELDQHMAMADALIATAKHYGMTDELIAAGVISAGS